MAGVTGLEPAASGVTGRRSNQLSYTPAASREEALRYRPSRRVSSAAMGFFATCGNLPAGAERLGSRPDAYPSISPFRA